MRSKARSMATSDRDVLPGQAGAMTLAESRLREASVRVTDARLKVLAALLEAGSASSHQDMQEVFADMDRVTLYRALDCLTEAGLAHKIAGDDRVFRYSPGTEQSSRRQHGGEHVHGAGHQHGHFKCTLCSRVFCLDGSVLGGAEAAIGAGDASVRPTMRQQLQATVLSTLGHGFKAHDIELTVKGWCADCGH